MSENMQWYLFCKSHPSLKLDANRHVLENFCRDSGLIITSPDTYEFHNSIPRSALILGHATCSAVIFPSRS